MNRMLEYKVTKIKTRSSDFTRDDVFDLNTQSGALRVFVIPFDDLYESFNVLYAKEPNNISIRSLSKLDMLSICEKVLSREFDRIEVCFLTYADFRMCVKNLENEQSWLLDSRHLKTHYIYSCFASLKTSITNVFEFTYDLSSSKKYLFSKYRDEDVKDLERFIEIRIINFCEEVKCEERS